MSPEQCRGGDIDGRSDIYACGVLLYQLVTGELPFTGETPLHTAMRHIHAQPRAPSELRRNLDPQLALDILGLFEEIHDGGGTVLFATHDRSLLDVRARRLIVLDEGKAIDVPNGVATAEDDLCDNELPV